jgi:hypothetical protein
MEISSCLNNPPEITSKKELSLIAAGATRKVAYEAMVAALDAESMTVDKYGEEHMTADHSTRIRAAEMISKLHGDLKENLVDNRVVNIAMSISPDELKTFMEMVGDVQKQLADLASSGKQTGEVIDVQAE